MEASNFYNTFSFIYPAIDFFLKKQKYQLVQILNNLPKGKVLEIGVGNGSHLKHYRNHEITAVDISVAMLAQAKKLAPSSITLLEMNGEDLKFANEQFEYVVICHTIAVTKDAAKMLNETFRVLKPEGKLFILNHFTPKKWTGFIDHLFEPFAKLLHFKSVFYPETVIGSEKFRLENEISFGRFAYFKLLILSKIEKAPTIYHSSTTN